MNKKNQTLLGANIRLKAELTRAKEEINSLTDECAEIRRQLSDLRRDNATLRTDLKTAHADTEQQAENFAATGKTLSDLHASQKAKLQALDGLQATLTQAQRDYDQLESQQNGIEARSAITQNSVELFRERSEQSQKEIERLNQTLAQLEQERDAATSNHDRQAIIQNQEALITTQLVSSQSFKRPQQLIQIQIPNLKK